MGKYIGLNASQKEEIRRLTQLANRRIKAAEKAYAKEGRTVTPKEIVGPYQIRERWATKSTPLSRSVKFESAAAYKRHLKFLQSFDPKAPGGDKRPGIKEYTEVQRTKTLISVENSLGTDVPPEIADKLNKMSAPQLAEFWKVYSDKAAKLGLKYASGDNMEATLEQFFPEDMSSFAERLQVEGG